MRLKAQDSCGRSPGGNQADDHAATAPNAWWGWTMPAPSGSNTAYRLPTLAEAIEAVSNAKISLFSSLESMETSSDVGDDGGGSTSQK